MADLGNVSMQVHDGRVLSSYAAGFQGDLSRKIHDGYIFSSSETDAPSWPNVSTRVKDDLHHSMGVPIAVWPNVTKAAPRRIATGGGSSGTPSSITFG